MERGSKEPSMRSRIILVLSIIVSSSALAASRGAETVAAVQVRAQRNAPVAKDFVWPVELDAKAERRMIELHANNPFVTPISLPPVMAHGAATPVTRELGGLYIAPTAKGNAIESITLRLGDAAASGFAMGLAQATTED
jgi:hypothetical protein